MKALLTPRELSFRVVSEGTIAVLNPEDTRRAPGASKEAARKKTFWNRFRLSQAEASGVSERNAGPTTAAQASSESDGGPKVEEVVVTARKREETSFEVPATISIYSREAIAESGADSISDIQY